MELLPEKYEVSRLGSCMLAALLICVNLIESGRNNIEVVEGWIQYLDEDGEYDLSLRFQHTWILADGELIDPTFEQFSSYTKDYFFERLIKKVYPAKLYVSTFEMNDSDPSKYFSDRIVPDYVKSLLVGVKDANGNELKI